jgi:2-succinyl-6-hydroxy-2,4-cyclohexadiene-1-carboxylate synthase
VNEPFVSLHGFTGSPSSWDEVAERLPGRHFVRPTLLGHAGEPAEACSFDAELDRLAAAFPAEPAHLAGYSLGARLALGLALRHPERVAKLTLIGVHPGLATEVERAERRRSDAELAALVETRGVPAFVERWEKLPLFASQARLPAATIARKHAERLRHDARGLAASLRSTGLGAMPDFTPLLETLRCPVTLLVGELDHKFVVLAQAAAARLAAAELSIVPDAGHDLLLERPAEVARVLARP